jgi:hypothetical protein
MKMCDIQKKYWRPYSSKNMTNTKIFKVKITPTTVYSLYPEANEKPALQSPPHYIKEAMSV